MAFSMEANVYLATYAVWSDPADDARLAAIRDQYDPQRRFPGFRVKPGANPNEFEAPDPA
jgi:FAD/FMN-containing dehydrogenase